MTQEKQTSIRILQSKPVKKSLGKPVIFLLGLISGIIFSSIFFLVLMNQNSSQKANDAIDETQTEQVLQQTTADNAEPASHHDDNAVDYKQHINDKDLNTVFQHPKKVEQPKSQSSSPFGNFFSHDAKPNSQVKEQPKIILKPDAKVSKPIVNKSETKTNPVDDAKEVTPDATVQMSIKTREIENTP